MHTYNLIYIPKVWHNNLCISILYSIFMKKCLFNQKEKIIVYHSNIAEYVFYIELEFLHYMYMGKILYEYVWNNRCSVSVS